MSRKFVVDTYTFVAAAKTIDMPSVTGLQIDGIQLITNIVDNVVIYQFNDPLLGGTLSGTTLTLTFDTTTMSDSDQLMIIYDSPSNTATNPVSVSGTVTVDGSGVTQPVSIAATVIVDGSGVTQPVSGTVAATQSGTWNVGVTGTVTVDGSGSTQPVSIASNVEVNLNDGAGTGITSHAAGASRGADIAVLDGSGNQVTAFINTEYTEDAASAANPIGIQVVTRRRDILSTETTTDGDVTALNSTGKGELYVKHADTVIVDGSGVTQPVSIATTVIVDGSGVTQPVSIASNVEVNVNDGAGTGITSHTAGASQGLDVSIIDGSGNQITSFGGGTQYTEDVASAADPIGNQLIARRRDSLSTETTTNGDNTALNSTGKGELYVKHADTVVVDGSGVTQPVSIVSNVDVNLHDGAGTAITSHTAGSSQGIDVSIIDGSGNQITSFGGGTQYTEDVAAVSDPIGTQLIARRRDTLSAETTTNGDNTALNSTSKGELYVKHADTVIVDGSGVTQPVSIALNVDVNLHDGAGTAITSHTAGASQGIDVSILDGSGNHVTTFGGGSEYIEGDAASSADPSSGVAWKDAEASGEWHITALDNPFPITAYDVIVSNTVAMGSTSNAQSVTGLEGKNTAGIQITGTWTGTLAFEGTADSTNWFVVNAVPFAGSTPTTTTTANGQWQSDISGLVGFRVRCSVTGTSTAVVNIRASTASFSLPTSTAIIQDGSGNALLSSTSMPATTDRGLIVRNINASFSNTASITGPSQTISITNIGGASVALIHVTGSFSLTLLPQVSANAGSNYINIGASPGNRGIFDVQKGIWIYEITAAGLYQVNISGANAFRINAAAYTSGTAVVYISLSNGHVENGKVNHNSSVISASSSGNNTIVSAVSGKKIRVTSWNFMANGTVNAKFTDGAGGSDLTGLYYMIVNTGISVPYHPEGYFTGSTNTALVINLSASIAIGGVITYSSVE